MFHQKKTFEHKGLLEIFQMKWGKFFTLDPLIRTMFLSISTCDILEQIMLCSGCLSVLSIMGCSTASLASTLYMLESPFPTFVTSKNVSGIVKSPLQSKILSWESLN